MAWIRRKPRITYYAARYVNSEPSVSTGDGIRELYQDCTVFRTNMFVGNVCKLMKLIGFCSFLFSSHMMVALD